MILVGLYEIARQELAGTPVGYQPYVTAGYGLEEPPTPAPGRAMPAFRQANQAVLAT